MLLGVPRYAQNQGQTSKVHYGTFRSLQRHFLQDLQRHLFCQLLSIPLLFFCLQFLLLWILVQLPR